MDFEKSILSIESLISKGILLKTRPGAILCNPSILMSETVSCSAIAEKDINKNKKKVLIFFINNLKVLKHHYILQLGIEVTKILLQVVGK